jgi:hypothetical protein
MVVVEVVVAMLELLPARLRLVQVAMVVVVMVVAEVLQQG